MQALKDLHEALIGLYSYSVEGDMAFTHYHRWLTGPGVKLGTRKIIVGKDDPNSPGAQYQYVTTREQLLENFVENGRNLQLHRRNVVIMANTIWEKQHRKRIARECGLARMQMIESDVFKELNWHRQAILHVSGILDKETKYICFFKKGDFVFFTKDHMYKLFSILINELNRLSKYYYGDNTQFSLDKPLNQPS